MNSTPDKVLMTIVTLLHCCNSYMGNIETETTTGSSGNYFIFFCLFHFQQQKPMVMDQDEFYARQSIDDYSDIAALLQQLYGKYRNRNY